MQRCSAGLYREQHQHSSCAGVIGGLVMRELDPERFG